MDPSQIIASLNSMSLGDLDAIEARLAEAESACLELDSDGGVPEIVDRLARARQAIGAADVREFRRNVEAAVSKLGHLR